MSIHSIEEACPIGFDKAVFKSRREYLQTAEYMAWRLAAFRGTPQDIENHNIIKTELYQLCEME